MATRNTYRDLALLLLLGTMLFVINIGGYDLWPADEPRFGQVAREMLDSGDWLVPRLNGQSYHEKPPLLFWAIAAVSAPFGDVTETTARIPSVAGALLTVVFTYLLAVRLFNRRVAWWAAIMLMTNVRFWWQARTVQTDMLLTAAMAAALYAFWRWHEAGQRRWLVALGIAVTFGLCSKGPPALVFPILLCFFFYRKRGHKAHRAPVFLAIGASVLLIAVWLVPARLAAVETAGTAQQAVGANLFRQTIGRFFLGVSKFQWPWYYLQTIPVDLLPWSLFLPWTVPWVWQRRRDGEPFRLLLSWILPTFAFFSICMGKRAVYLLPLFPAFAILIAMSVLDLVDGERARWRRGTNVAWGVLLVVTGALPFAAMLTPYREYVSHGICIWALCALGFGADTLHRGLRGDVRAPHVTMACHFAGLALLTALLVFPKVNEYKSARPFCAPLRRLSDSNVEYKLYSVCFFREEYIFYARHLCEVIQVEEALRGEPEIDVVWVDGAAPDHLMRAIANGTAEVPVASFSAISEEEVRQLAVHFNQILAASGLPPENTARLTEQLGLWIEDFRKRFNGSTPAFLLVREQDWRWMLPLCPALQELAVILRATTGHRDVLLMANAAGLALLSDADGAPGAPPIDPARPAR